MLLIFHLFGYYMFLLNYTHKEISSNMKMKNFFLPVFFLGALFLSSCTSASFELTSDGLNHSAPFDVEKLEKSIKTSLVNYNWSITDINDGLITAQYSKSNGVIVADIKVEYDSEGYSITYVDSKNLDANLKRMTIHKNYNRWIANLNKTISMNYMVM